MPTETTSKIADEDYIASSNVCNVCSILKFLSRQWKIHERISYFLDYLHFIHYVPSTISIYEKGIIHYHITGVLQDVLAEEERCKQEADTEDAARYQELSHTYRLANTGSRPSVTRKRLKIVQKVEVKNGIPKKCINMYCCQCCQMSPITIFGIKWSCCPISGQTHKMFCSRRFRSCCHF